MRSFVSRFLIVAVTIGFYTSAAQAANVTVNVDYTNPRQTIEGFGASATWVANDLDAFSPAPTSVTPHRTSASENQVQLSPINISAGAFTITIPSKSVVTVVG